LGFNGPEEANALRSLWYDLEPIESLGVPQWALPGEPQ
jgi:hypothetical protein